jgi:hypothetical protein
METNVRQQKTLDSSLSVMNLGKKCEFLLLLGVMYERFFPLTICNREDITFFYNTIAWECDENLGKSCGKLADFSKLSSLVC